MCSWSPVNDAIPKVSLQKKVKTFHHHLVSLKIINSTVSEKVILQYINIFCSKMDEVSETFESKNESSDEFLF